MSGTAHEVGLVEKIASCLEILRAEKAREKR
jgi:hypothetical protein